MENYSDRHEKCWYCVDLEDSYADNAKSEKKTTNAFTDYIKSFVVRLAGIVM